LSRAHFSGDQAVKWDYTPCSSMPDNTSSHGMAWLLFALLTVVSWGVYGVFLHTGQVAMSDPVNGRYKAFLFVGIAYFLTAVLAPLVMLVVSGASWNFPPKGAWWSLLAGIVGAIGAFGVLLAFGAKGTPAVVMSIVFAGAPIVNAIVALMLHPPAGGWGAIKPQFYLGIVLAAAGGCLVTFFKPPAAPARTQTGSAHMTPATPTGVKN
jgi:drug/metabolite transporter (DMT)-like permease